MTFLTLYIDYIREVNRVAVFNSHISEGTIGRRLVNEFPLRVLPFSNNQPPLKHSGRASHSINESGIAADYHADARGIVLVQYSNKRQTRRHNNDFRRNRLSLIAAVTSS